MKPLFTYHVPETAWYILVTDTSNHFYFNSNDKCSHWQLHDLQERYGIDVAKFAASINFDELGVLMAKSRGVGIEEKEEVPVETQPDEENIVIENVQESAASPPPPPPPPKEQPQSLLQGYSSSEEEDEEDEQVQEEPLDLDNIAAQAIAQHQPQDSDLLSEDEENDNNSLDLSLDDDQNQPSATQDFMNLLDQFSGRFSIYQSWDLIEEELIEEFAKYPEFLAIPSKHEKDKLFQKWCSQQEDQEEAVHDVEAGIFPTPTIKYLAFLQDFKLEIKDAFYQTFYSANHEKINEFDLPASTKETIFRSFKIMLNDFTKFAKNFKKQNKNSNQNVKVMKLNEFLRGKLQGSYTIDPELSHFDNWIKLLNANDISAEIAENEINFLVGDEKRLHSYIDQLTNN
ncbi:hypothetical protein Cantr_00008 [Candida viswanathii]|uniref:Uncharacterized protein n=1 Tax=Candida viswanathii TaxID=5486 RepID=A0A367YFJ0_9ASCO|nr:hypothetical protein Cantr_00008 [Candida viswanathii]